MKLRWKQNPYISDIKNTFAKRVRCPVLQNKLSEQELRLFSFLQFSNKRARPTSRPMPINAKKERKEKKGNCKEHEPLPRSPIPSRQKEHEHDTLSYRGDITLEIPILIDGTTCGQGAV